MNIGGGLTFFVHLIIILVHWIIKKPIHFIIILFVLVLFFVQFIYISKNSFKDNNLNYIVSNFIKNSNDNIGETFNANIDSNIICDEKPEIVSSKKYVILMMDDIESLYLRPVVMKMLNDSIGRNIPYTVGITPLNIKYDFQLASFLKQNKCFLELAQHGYNDRDDIPEFQDLSESVAYEKLRNGLDILNSFTDSKVITFIAPKGLYSSGTLSAAKKSQIKIISGNGDAFFDFIDYSLLDGNNSNYGLIVDRALKDIDIKGFSMIMIHPNDYINNIGEIDFDKYNQYIKLLNKFDDKGFTYITISDYYNYLQKNGLKTDFFDSGVKLPEYGDKMVSTEFIGNL